MYITYCICTTYCTCTAYCMYTRVSVCCETPDAIICVCLAALQALKRYEARKTQSKTSSTAAGQQSETSFAGHAAAAYCMVFATLAFFFVVQ